MDIQVDLGIFKKFVPQDHFKKFVSRGLRPSGRGLSESREVKATVGLLSNCSGSAMVKIGNTAVIGSVRLEAGLPQEENPENGFVVANVDIPIVCNSEGKIGGASQKAQILTHLLTAMIDKNNCIDLSSLCIESGSAVWTVYLDVVVVSDDAALFEATFAAAYLALSTARMPIARLDEIDMSIRVDVDGENARMKLGRSLAFESSRFGLFVSLGYSDGNIIQDPSRDEEDALDYVIRYAFTVDDVICACSKVGGRAITCAQMSIFVDEARRRARKIFGICNCVLQGQSVK